MIKEEDLITIQRLYFGVNDDGICCQMQEVELVDDLNERAFFILNFPVSKEPIKWFVEYDIIDEYGDYKGFPTIWIYDIKK